MLLRKYAYFFDIFRQISTAIYITFTKCRIFVEKRVKKWSKSLKLALFCVIFSEKILSFFETFTGLLRGVAVGRERWSDGTRLWSTYSSLMRLGGRLVTLQLGYKHTQVRTIQVTGKKTLRVIRKNRHTETAYHVGNSLTIVRDGKMVYSYYYKQSTRRKSNGTQ